MAPPVRVLPSRSGRKGVSPGRLPQSAGTDGGAAMPGTRRRAPATLVSVPQIRSGIARTTGTRSPYAHTIVRAVYRTLAYFLQLSKLAATFPRDRDRSVFFLEKFVVFVFRM